MTLALTPLRPGEKVYAAFIEVLRDSGLPTDDLDDGARVYVGRDDGAVVAFGGLEGDGPDQLIRSVVVSAGARGGGYGLQVAQALAGQARADGEERLWLLTTSADGFFASLGWTVMDRASAPEAVRTSRPFSGLWPLSAVLMCRRLA